MEVSVEVRTLNNSESQHIYNRDSCAIGGLGALAAGLSSDTQGPLRVDGVGNVHSVASQRPLSPVGAGAIT
jgi:hypothetical protein